MAKWTVDRHGWKYLVKNAPRNFEFRSKVVAELLFSIFQRVREVVELLFTGGKMVQGGQNWLGLGWWNASTVLEWTEQEIGAVYDFPATKG